MKKLNRYRKSEISMIIWNDLFGFFIVFSFRVEAIGQKADSVRDRMNSNIFSLMLLQEQLEHCNCTQNNLPFNESVPSLSSAQDSQISFQSLPDVSIFDVSLLQHGPSIQRKIDFTNKLLVPSKCMHHRQSLGGSPLKSNNNNSADSSMNRSFTLASAMSSNVSKPALDEDERLVESSVFRKRSDTH